MHGLNLSKEDEALVNTARNFARDYVRPRAAEWERARKMPREALAEAARLGLTELDARRTGDGGFLAKLLVLEAISEEDFAFAFSMTNTQGTVGRLVRIGTPSQKERWLEDVRATRRLAASRGASAWASPPCAKDGSRRPWLVSMGSVSRRWTRIEISTSLCAPTSTSWISRAATIPP